MKYFVNTECGGFQSDLGLSQNYDSALYFYDLGKPPCKTRPNSWAKQVRKIEWGHLTLDSMTF